MLKRFIAYYKPHLFMFSLDMLASLFISLIGMLYPIITRNMLNDYIPNKNIDAIVFFWWDVICTIFCKNVTKILCAILWSYDWCLYATSNAS